MRLDHIKARAYQLVAEITYRPPVCRDDRMIELLDDVTIEEADQQGTPWAESVSYTHLTLPTICSV